MGYWLLDHRNRHGDHFYRSRNRPVVAVVLHCTAGLEDLDMVGPDASAEKTARYAATTSRAVSWHSGSDSDSVLELLPPDYTAFHCRGYNSSTYGHEISKRNMTWSDEPPAWVDATLRRAAGHLGALAGELDVPIRHITRAELDRAADRGDPRLGGFVGHRELDPSRRSDPGQDFPWDRFLALASGEHAPPVPPARPSSDDEAAAAARLRRGSTGVDVRRVQGMLVAHGYELDVDGDYGPRTEQAVRRFQLQHGMGVDGIVGPATWLALEGGRPMVRRPQRGLGVRLVQGLLVAAGHELAIDGVFGATTEGEVRDFQQSHELDADGIAGPQTWRTLLAR